MEHTIPYEDLPRLGRMNFLSRISWSAVFAGVLVAIVTQMLLTLLGLGIGLGTIDPMEEQNPMAGLGIGSAIWYIISSLISLFLGGWVAGRLASAPRLFDGIIHGVLTWCLVTLLTIYFLTTTLGSLIGGAGRLVGGIVKTAGSAASAAGPGLGNMVQDQLKANGVDTDKLDLGNLKNEVTTLLRQTSDPNLNPDALERKTDQAGDQTQTAASRAASNPQESDAIAGSLFSRLFKQGQSTVNSVDREDAVNVVMKRTGKSRAESEQTVDNWISSYKQAAVKFEQTKQEAKVKARQAGDAAAAAGSKAAIFGFIGLLIGVVASGYGAKMGTDSKDDSNTYDRSVREVVR
ncbi:MULTISPECIES: YrzE family protein [Spirosoma]|uniref:YrzE family protein n=1 Tax=Spirosoma liriopis TaxID=2937440 RepID=A0ABT0HTS5_9BACT|nr:MULTISPECIES: YrzE family protein [Spirosoma]MCK8495585.1 YrzE family protein [Spirosoma liriopis]UHG94613.1 YrzE family protein [Spirosoma oryzicola]